MNLTPKILAILHDQDIINAYRLFFTQQGFDIEGVCSIKEGWDICLTNPPDILIVLRMMEEANDGLQLCQQLRKSPSPLNTMPIIIGWADIVPPTEKQGWQVAYQQAFEAGANACFGRVYSHLDILKFINMLVANPDLSGLTDR